MLTAAHKIEFDAPVLLTAPTNSAAAGNTWFPRKAWTSRLIAALVAPKTLVQIEMPTADPDAVKLNTPEVPLSDLRNLLTTAIYKLGLRKWFC